MKSPINTPYNQNLKDMLEGSALIDDLCPQVINCKEVMQVTTASSGLQATETDVAILFLDVRNYTGMLQNHPAKEFTQVISRLFTVFSKVVSNFKGKVIERAGDSLYAVFGLQNNLKEAVNQAYQSARMIFDTLGMFNNNYALSYYGHALELGMGMHAGNVVVSHIDMETHSQMTVMGLPVNIASRLQAETKVVNNDLIISEYAYGMLDLEQHENHEHRLVQLQGIPGNQRVRLAGQAYGKHAKAAKGELGMEFLLAISG